MKYCLGLVIFIFVFVGLSGTSEGAEGENCLVFFRGEEIKLTLKKENGRFYGLHQEMINLVPEVIPPRNEEDEQAGLNWVPLRVFWEKAGFQVNWLPELKAIIISEKTDSFTLPPEALTIIGQAIADVDWLKYKTEDALREHLEQYYTPEAVDGMIKDTLEFVNIETDWHIIWALEDAEVIYRGENRCLVKVTVSERVDPFSEPVIFPGMIRLEHQEAGWRIDYHRFLAD